MHTLLFRSCLDFSVVNVTQCNTLLFFFVCASHPTVFTIIHLLKVVASCESAVNDSFAECSLSLCDSAI